MGEATNNNTTQPTTPVKKRPLSYRYVQRSLDRNINAGDNNTTIGNLPGMDEAMMSLKSRIDAGGITKDDINMAVNLLAKQNNLSDDAKAQVRAALVRSSRYETARSKGLTRTQHTITPKRISEEQKLNQQRAINFKKNAINSNQLNDYFNMDVKSTNGSTGTLKDIKGYSEAIMSIKSQIDGKRFTTNDIENATNMLVKQNNLDERSAQKVRSSLKAFYSYESNRDKNNTPEVANLGNKGNERYNQSNKYRQLVRLTGAAGAGAATNNGQTATTSTSNKPNNTNQAFADAANAMRPQQPPVSKPKPTAPKTSAPKPNTNQAFADAASALRPQQPPVSKPKPSAPKTNANQAFANAANALRPQIKPAIAPVKTGTKTGVQESLDLLFESNNYTYRFIRILSY